MLHFYVSKNVSMIKRSYFNYFEIKKRSLIIFNLIFYVNYIFLNFSFVIVFIRTEPSVQN